MKTVYLNRSDPSVDKIIKASFPEFTGKSIEAIITDEVQFYGTQWSGGYRREYVVLSLETFRRVDIPEAPFLRPSELHQKAFVIPDKCVVVCLNRGPFKSLEIMGPASNITPQLEQTVQLTLDEKIVLCATRRYKSSYGGVSNYRFVEAKRSTGISEFEYNQAKQSLVSKGLLNKAGAITIDGRNVIGDANIYDLGKEKKSLG